MFFNLTSSRYDEAKKNRQGNPCRPYIFIQMDIAL